MNCVINVKHVRTPVFMESGKRLSSRKFTSISEVRDANTLQSVFEWNASTDTFQEKLDQSYLLKKIGTALDIPVSKLVDELEYRKRVLMYMVEHGIRDYKSVNAILSKYYNNPKLFQKDFMTKSDW
jgi:flagellar protein FlaI